MTPRRPLQAVLLVVLLLGISSALPGARAEEVEVIEAVLPRAGMVWDGFWDAGQGAGYFASGESKALYRLRPGALAVDQEIPYPFVWTAFAPDGSGHAYAFGGLPTGSSTPRDTIERIDLATGEIVVMGARLPRPLWGHDAIWDGRQRPDDGCPVGCAYVLGGRYAGSSQTNEIVRYDPSSDTVSVLPVALPIRPIEMSVVWTGSVAYVMGGYDGIYSDLIVRFDPAAGTVTTLPSRLPGTRAYTSGVWDGAGHAYLFGGITTGNVHVDDVIRFDPDTGNVSLVADLPTPRRWTGAFHDGANAYVGGGIDTRSIDEIVRVQTFVAEAPVTTANLTGTLGNVGWHRSNVTVTLACAPPTGSNCTATRYRLDEGSSRGYGEPFVVEGEGRRNISFGSTSSNGGIEVERTIALAIDTQPPAPVATHDCATPGAPGWCRQATGTLTTTATDATSGVAGTSCSLNSIWVPIPCGSRTFGQGAHTACISASDVAGNSAPRSCSALRLDDVAPEASLMVDCETPGDADWCRDRQATVRVHALDATSGGREVACTVDGEPFWCVGSGTGTAVNATVRLAKGLEAPTAAWGGDAAYVFGGREGPQGVPSKQIQRYDGHSVVPMGAMLPLPLSEAGAVWDGASIYLFGGNTAWLGTDAQDTILRYDPQTDSVEVMGASLPWPSVGVKAVWAGDQAYVTARYGASRQIVRYDPVEDSASVLPLVLPPSMGGVPMVWDGSSLFLFSAEGILRVSPADASMTWMSATLPPHMNATSAVWDGRYAYALGGWSDGPGSRGLIARYDPIADTAELLAASIPMGGSGAPAVWDGAEAQIFAGFTSFRSDQIVRFSPANAFVATEGSRDVCARPTDRAGNTGSSSCVVVKLDATPPDLDLALTPAPNGEGWSRSPTQLAWTCTDAVSGVQSAPQDVLFTQERELAPIEGVCRDVAGNERGLRLPALGIDLTPPTLAPLSAIEAEADRLGGARVAFGLPNAADELSGLDTVICLPAPDGVFPLGVTRVTCTARDRAGNEAERDFDVRISPGALARIEITGPSTVRVGTRATYVLAGFDAYGNTVALGTDRIELDAPERMGTVVVSHEEAGIFADVEVTIVHDDPLLLKMEGPATVWAGYAGRFHVLGVDRFENVFEIEGSPIDLFVPTRPGKYVFERTFAGLTASASYEVVLPPVARVKITTPFPVANLEHPFALEARAYDEFDRLILHAPIAWETDEGSVSSEGVLLATRVGTANVTAASGVIVALHQVTVSDELLVGLTVTDDELELRNGRIEGQATVRFLDGAPAVAANVTVRLHSDDPHGIFVDQSASGGTDATGTFRFVLFGVLASPSASYVVDADATWHENMGSDREEVRQRDPVAVPFLVAVTTQRP